MNRPWDREPTPEQLAAYFDGELAGPDRVAVEAWLATHPDGRAEVEALRQLHAHYDALPVPEPSPERWDAAYAAVEARLVAPRRNWTWAVVVAGLAAAVVGVLLLPRGVAPDGEPYPVVSADEVRIISMNPNDHKALVGVQALELAEVDLVTHPDVEILGGATEEVVRIDDWATPMLVDTLALGGPR